MITINIPAAVLLVLASSCAVLSSFLLWQEIGEINRKLPDSERISYWGMYPAKMARVIQIQTSIPSWQDGSDESHISVRSDRLWCSFADPAGGL